MSLRLVRLPLAVFEALADEKVAEAERLSGLTMTEWFAGRTEIWDYMISLLDGRPDHADWLMQAVAIGDVVIGNAGFKGAPKDGEVELGYSIAPDHRRRGHASIVVAMLLDRAHQAGVDRVIARINPDNLASIGVVTKAGFVPDGDYLSPRSGRQLQFARQIGRAPQ
ncbi:MAG: [ribosomal protein S5]-alanine N-acetyltransferase [Nocardioidaceae bacterium]|nr:[ribosomal protein S5]-alanine N-acetyltransferase [Nocardioidaceae bacterium]